MTETSLGFADDMSPLHMFITLLDAAREQGAPDEAAIAQFVDKFHIQSRVDRVEEMSALETRNGVFADMEKKFKAWQEIFDRDAVDPFDGKTLVKKDQTWSMEDVKRDGKFPE